MHNLNYQFKLNILFFSTAGQQLHQNPDICVLTDLVTMTDQTTETTETIATGTVIVIVTEIEIEFMIVKMILQIEMLPIIW